jgi:hemerythrin
MLSCRLGNYIIILDAAVSRQSLTTCEAERSGLDKLLSRKLCETPFRRALFLLPFLPEKEIKGAFIMTLWTEALTTGVREMDEPHREFFARLQTLITDDVCTDPGKILDDAEARVKEFFDMEEALQAASGYPNANSHKMQHNSYMVAFRRVKEHILSDGHTLANALAFNRNVVEWLRRHIRGDDMDFAEYYNSPRQ